MPIIEGQCTMWSPNRCCIQHGKVSLSLSLSLLVLLGSALWPGRAIAQNPIPLPTDGNLAAYVGVSGAFQSVATAETRNLTMATWAAAFGPGEPFDFSALDSRAFQTLELPEDQGWGLFEALGPNLTLNLRITDALNRLGSVRVYEVDTGRHVGTYPAAVGGGQVQATFENDFAIRDYRMEIVSSGGAVLSTLAVDAGKWDTVYPFTIGGGFEPYYPEPVNAPPHWTAGPDDVATTKGDPKQAPGVISGTYPGFSKSACGRNVTNDAPTLYPLDPPGAFAQYVKRGVIANTVNIGRFKVGDPAALQALQNAINQASVQDLTRALGNVDVTPYTDATAAWYIEFRGQATAVLAVPFEKKRKGSGFSALVAGIAQMLRPSKGFLSILAVAAADLWLADEANRVTSGFKQGDVMAWGDIYALIAAESTRRVVRTAPILQTVTFVLQPDIPPPSGGGTATLTGLGAWTTPAPAVPQSGGTLAFGSSTNWTTTMDLPKGFKWKVSGKVNSPMGYVEDGATEFQTPASGNVNIRCKLTVLIELKIFTVGPEGPMGIKVTVKNSAGTVVAEGDSVRQSDDKYAFSAMTLQPGSYTVSALRATSGGTWQGSKSVNVQIGIKQEETLNITYTPPRPPGP